MKRATLLLAAFGLCCNRTPASPAPTPSSTKPAASAAAQPKLPALGAPPPLARSQDGLPILRVKARASEHSGGVRFVRPLSKTLEWTSSEASDGKRTWVAISKQGPDVIVRDGEVREGLLRSLGVRLSGCAAALDGTVLLSGIAEPEQRQIVVRIDASGEPKRQTLPPTVAPSSDCRLWMAKDGRFALASFGIVTWDGKRFSEDRSFFAGRTTMGSVDGPKFCFRYCNAAEKAATPPATRAILEAVGDGGNADFVAYGRWVAATAKGRAVRWRKGKLERLDGLPESKILNGHYDAVFTERGDLVIAFDYHFARYAVWPIDAKALSPTRTLAAGDVLAKASPTLIVRGLGGAVPKSDTYAVLLGKSIGYGTGGGTFGYRDLRRSAEAHRAQIERARAVLNEKKLLVTHEAVLDPKCGAYVRSPVGWEGMKMSDFSPPTLPKLSKRAVTRQPKCLPLASVTALPGDPDLLLAISGGQLYGAWLPPPLPLPQGSHFGRRLDKGPLVQHPKPGSGWTKLGRAESLSGEDAVAAPGTGTKIEPGTWQAGGAAIIGVDGREILLTPLGAALLPKGTRPMAVGTAQRFHVWGALGGKLVECTERCRVLDPGVPKDIVAVVPRTETQLLLGYADGRVGVYDAPPTGGESVAKHPLVAPLTHLLKAKPRN